MCQMISSEEMAVFMDPNQVHILKNYTFVFLSLTFKPNPYLHIKYI